MYFHWLIKAERIDIYAITLYKNWKSTLISIKWLPYLVNYLIIRREIFYEERHLFSELFLENIFYIVVESKLRVRKTVLNHPANGTIVARSYEIVVDSY